MMTTDNRLRQLKITYTTPQRPFFTIYILFLGVCLSEHWNPDPEFFLMLDPNPFLKLSRIRNRGFNRTVFT
jgi:hypothetical protein